MIFLASLRLISVSGSSTSSTTVTYENTLIGDDTFISYAKEQEEKKEEEESFKDIIEPKHKLPKKLPLIAFGVTLVILVIVIIILLIK